MGTTKQNNKTHILARYALISGLFLIFSIGIILKLFNTTIVNANAWNKRARNELSRVDTIKPERGNILADNGNILACNLKVYDIRVDLRHNKILKIIPMRWDWVEALADSLDRYYPRTIRRADGTIAEGESWHKKLREELEKPENKRTRALRIVQKGTLDDFARIRNFPFFDSIKGKGTRFPLYTEERNIRMYPYGKMAYRSIGRVNENCETQEFHGYSGLEKDLDSLLYGQPGLAKRVPMTSGIGTWVTKAPLRGFDILSTINIDLQEMLEQELHNICLESNAEWGTAILMEVETGEIKAISNIERLENGTYGEALNRAVTAFEPGSVMKPISMMIAFEDGLVRSVNDMIDCSPFQRTKDPHAPGVKSVKQVVEMSSNTGTARIIFRGYANNPERFHDRLASIGFFDPMHSGIAGEQIPQIRRLLPQDVKGNNITLTARHLDLARQAYGYNTMIPPLYTLAYYNAIANGGKLVRPHLVRALRYEDGRDSVLPISYIRERICSVETAEKVKQCIHDVVWGEHGTARGVRDDRVKVVGKTGTAYPVENGSYNLSKRRYAFAGFFPYEKPRYSCMALILGPGGTSANKTSGQVVKNIALKMYARGIIGAPSERPVKQPNGNRPVASASLGTTAEKIGKTVHASKISNYKAAHPAATSPGTMPDVKGYDVRSAVKILEERGINVKVSGTGRVVAQSVNAGTKIQKGSSVLLTLKI